MTIGIVIPVHNEEQVLDQNLKSLVQQTKLPDKLLIVNDNSTDNSQAIIQQYTQQHIWIDSIELESSPEHLPGAKVINAFRAGLNQLDSNYDLICKFDADIVFPPDYLEKLVNQFNLNPKLGICGGLPTVYLNGKWIFENIASKKHVRGPVKAYRKECYEAIGGLKESVGWDTIDVLLANYNGWEARTIPDLYVKHLKPTGKTYSRSARLLQGQALYRMRYGWVLSLLALIKSALRRGEIQFLIRGIQGYRRSQRIKDTFLVSEEEGRFIRAYRWKNILNKLSFRKNR